MVSAGRNLRRSIYLIYIHTSCTVQVKQTGDHMRWNADPGSRVAVVEIIDKSAKFSRYRLISEHALLVYVLCTFASFTWCDPTQWYFFPDFSRMSKFGMRLKSSDIAKFSFDGYRYRKSIKIIRSDNITYMCNVVEG